MKDMGRKIAEKAIERQFEIMAEQQKKGQEFVNEKVRKLTKTRPQNFSIEPQDIKPLLFASESLSHPHSANWRKGLQCDWK